MEPSTAAAADSPGGGACGSRRGRVEPDGAVGRLGGATSSGSRRFAGKSAISISRRRCATCIQRTEHNVERAHWKCNLLTLHRRLLPSSYPDDFLSE